MLSYYTVKQINNNLFQLIEDNGASHNMTKKKMTMFINNMRKVLGSESCELNKLDRLQERFRLLDLETFIEGKNYE
tara:strand:+ start:396 stop:623 length:228 start_codon:yes stop_codon:yes gene_type:complete